MSSRKNPEKPRRSFRASISGLALLALAALTTACGNSPLGMLETDKTEIPTLGLPIAIDNSTAYFASGTDLTRSDYFVFVLNTGFSSITPVAPAAGVVIEQTGDTVILMHSARLSTRISNISAQTVRVGDYLAQGQQLSATQFTGWQGGNSAGFRFEVLLDGKAVCPWSFFSTQTRLNLIAIANTYFGQQVCSQ
jgi:hypothetical protein